MEIRFAGCSLKRMVLVFVVPISIIIMQLVLVQANTINHQIIAPLAPSPSPTADHSPVSSPTSIMSIIPAEGHQEINWIDPRVALKKFVFENVLKCMKVPEPIKNVLSRSGAFADCVLSKFWGCSFLVNEKFTFGCYAAVGAICLKQFKIPTPELAKP